MVICADIAWLLVTWFGPLNLSTVDWKNVPHYFWMQMKTAQVLTVHLSIWTTPLKPSQIIALLPSVLNTVFEVKNLLKEEATCHLQKVSFHVKALSFLSSVTTTFQSPRLPRAQRIQDWCARVQLQPAPTAEPRALWGCRWAKCKAGTGSALVLSWSPAWARTWHCAPPVHTPNKRQFQDCQFSSVAQLTRK